MNNNLDKMLGAASKRLGTTPEKLKEALEQKDLSSALSNLDSKDSQKLKSLMSDPQTMKKLMSSEKFREMLKKMK